MNSLLLTILNESNLICSHTVTWFQVLLFNIRVILFMGSSGDITTKVLDASLGGNEFELVYFQTNAFGKAINSSVIA